MNFLTKPPEGLLPNAHMDEEQQAVAGNFVAELVELGLCGGAPGDCLALLNAPLFVAPNSGPDALIHATWLCNLHTAQSM